MKTFLEFYRESTLPDFTDIVLYHGSNVEFDVFDFEKFGQTDSGTMGAGFYLTGDPEKAQIYAENAARYRQSGEPVVMAFRVKAKKTLVIDSNNVSVWENKMRELGIEPGKIHDNVKELINKGFDSIASMSANNVEEMVVFKPGLAKREA
ncbi:hypothetical protein [Salmonella phage SS9]|uniref:ART-PolyVal-like domain-containing protein n=3 Tax=Kuttervirus TaxID=2169536 RepID=A0A2H5BPA3_9CAUD|nr:hypothetical protein HYP55_gp027 [Salmonella phage Mutine]YP_009883103.1 hypothetical protein HYP88_gp014 [Salmonella phage SS9]AUG88162.1 hypothetical protein CPT_Mutine_027 [Salmonella phage Mutine]QEI24123.1 hypothetical protein [Salmonella phage SS3]QEI24179.1 hypothetical protein [Salmonella phage SS9]